MPMRLVWLRTLVGSSLVSRVLVVMLLGPGWVLGATLGRSKRAHRDARVPHETGSRCDQTHKQGKLVTLRDTVVRTSLL